MENFVDKVEKFISLKYRLWKTNGMKDGVSHPVIDFRTMKPIGSNIVWGLVEAGLRRQNLDGGFLSADDAKRDWESFLTTAALRAAETTGP